MNVYRITSSDNIVRPQQFSRKNESFGANLGDNSMPTSEKIPLKLKLPNRQQCPHNEKLSCSNCRLNELCLPIALNNDEVILLDNIVERNRPLKKAEYLYRQADKFKSVYAVRTGSFKSFVLDAQGNTRVTGFYLPGEIIGMDGIASEEYANSLVALEHASVCEIPFTKLENLSQQIPSLQHHFYAIMGNEIAIDKKVHTLLSSYTAEERIGSFLLSISSRYAHVGLSAIRFMLPMTRNDIAEFLGLTLETVSRLISGLQRKGLVSVNNREIELLDIDGLKKIVASS